MVSCNLTGNVWKVSSKGGLGSYSELCGANPDWWVAWLCGLYGETNPFSSQLVTFQSFGMCPSLRHQLMPKAPLTNTCAPCVVYWFSWNTLTKFKNKASVMQRKFIWLDSGKHLDHACRCVMPCTNPHLHSSWIAFSKEGFATLSVQLLWKWRWRLCIARTLKRCVSIINDNSCTVRV